MDAKPSGDWLFYGGTAALDFINTLRDRALSPRETLNGPEDLSDWLMRAGIVHSRSELPEPTQVEYERALVLRDALDALLAPHLKPSAEQVRTINAAAQQAPVPQLSENQPTRVRTAGRSVPELLGSIAADGISIVAEGLVERVKVCAHSHCGLRYLDRSRAGKRQWCSMQRCGNRAKASRHAVRSSGKRVF